MALVEVSPQSEIAALVQRYAPSDGEHRMRVPGLTFYRSSSPSEAVHIVQEPALCLVVQGSKRVSLGDEEFPYDPKRFLMVSVGLPIAGRVVEATAERPYLGVRIDLDMALVAALMVEADTEGGPETTPKRGITVGMLEAPLEDAVMRLIRLLERPAHVPVLAPLILREIVFLLLTGPEGAHLRGIALTNGQAHRIAGVIERLRRDFARPLRIEEIAREVGMSPSGLHHHFKAVTAMSPLQFQKRLRLQEARRLLLGEDMDAAGAAFQVGYESPSQFSREYRRMFGVPPRQDVARIRTSGGLPTV